MVDDIVESLPDLGRVWSAHDVALDDAPVFAVLAVADDLILESAVLFLLKSSGITFHNPLLLSYHTKQLN